MGGKVQAKGPGALPVPYAAMIVGAPVNVGNVQIDTIIILTKLGRQGEYTIGKVSKVVPLPIRSPSHSYASYPLPTNYPPTTHQLPTNYAQTTP
jgi:hypothetical protein